MNIARLRQPAIGAASVLLISGAGIAFAGSSPAKVASPAIQRDAAAVVLAEPAVVPAAAPAEPTGPDTDTLQQGDQTTPDAPGTAATVKTATVKSATAPAAAEATGSEGATAESTTAETEQTGAEADGPGGHADNPSDPKADHQFQGEE